MKLHTKFETGRRPATAAKPMPPPAPERKVSPAARNLALAHYLDRLIEKGLITDYTQAARMLGVSQPRLTHLMALLLLAPPVQEAILLGRTAPGDKELRRLPRIAGVWIRY